MLHRIAGVGLPNIYLKNGYSIEGVGDESTVAYTALEGLYRAIAGALSRRAAPLTGLEFKFLRKRLSLSQTDVGALLGKTAQAVAKWEKGLTSLPLAEGRLLRLVWLARFSRRELGRVVDMMVRAGDYVPADYAFALVEGRWVDQSQALISQRVQYAQHEATAAIGRAMNIAPPAYTLGSTGTVVPGTLRSQQDATT